MRYLLDTDICIYYINGFEPEVREKIHQLSASDIVVSAITKCEMYAGSSGSKIPARSRAEQDFFLRHFISLPFDDLAADKYGEIYAELKRGGKLIEKLDIQIAAITLVHNLTLVTHNTRHYSRVPNLAIEDWTIDSAS
ncbi:MAG: type II toxin-antitoxin system VapC family toxin [Chloroflexota bacterium]|nr:type II toxin-antitoxin system VapC family toxin [Chloroflexota bacterium]